MRSASHIELGARGERDAAAWLERKGWRLLDRNIRRGHGELDISAMDGDELVIVEVRSRSVGVMQPPELSVGPRKLRRLIKAAKKYVDSLRFGGNWRIDVVAVTYPRCGGMHIELFRDITMGMEADAL